MDATRPLDLMDRIESHPGKTAMEAWSALYRVHRVLLGNQDVLRMFLDQAERDDDDGYLARWSERENEFFDTFVMLLHNYVASVKTMVDHSRNLVRTYEGQSFSTEYRERTDALKQIPIVRMVQDLRNMVLHARVPPVALTVSFDQHDVNVTCALERDAALSWSGWSGVSRRFLRDQPVQVPVRQLAESYATAINGLNVWLFEQFTVLHGTEVAELEDLVRRFHGIAPPENR